MKQSTRHQTVQRTASAKVFRPDINALRAIAVTSVVAFHAGLTGIIPGGFIGVDVFYVISGFLITGLLLREAQETGRVNLRLFWAKRLRRLMPALALVVAVTLPIALLTLSPLVWADLAKAAIASITYVSNFLFALEATDYFADDLAQSPFLHTWSLGIEEQFYVLWPLLILLAFLVARCTKLPVRKLLIFVFTGIILVSMALSALLTETRPGLAFYLLPTRAWEFAAGGLLAVLPAGFLARGKTFGRALVALGIGLLAGGFLMISATDPFPGILAGIPVLGTLLVIAGGSSSIPSLLGWRPLQWTGERSYSWYLWHWPVIVLSSAAFQTDSVWLKIAGALASLALAALTFTHVENRYRWHPRLVASPGLTFLAAGSAIAVVGVMAMTAAMVAASLTSSPTYARFAQARAVVSDQICHRESTSAGGHRLCEMGDVDADETIMLIGDSHAGHWKNALSTAASQSHVRLLVRWMSACPAGGLNVLDSKGNGVKGCMEFHAESLAIVHDERPKAVILAQSNGYSGRILSPQGETLTEAEQLSLWRSAFASRISLLKGTGAAVGVIEDNPGTPIDSPLCATRLLGSSDACTVTRADALSESLRKVDAEVVSEAPVAATYSPVDSICGPVDCQIVTADGVPIYRDRTHLSDQWTKTQIPKLQSFIEALQRGK